MRAVGTRYVVLAAVVAACSTWTLPLAAETRAERTRAAAKLVEQTLEREAKEGVEDRAEALRPAIEKAPNYEYARWQSGHLYDAKRKAWLDVDQVQQRAAEDSRLTLYRNAREKHSDNAASQTDMARWCLKHKMEDQARAHYSNILSVAPDHQEARRQLGFMMINGAWVSPQEMADARQRIESAQAALVRRAPELEKLLKRMDSSNPQARELARKELMRVKDPDYVPAIEAVMSTQGGETALLGIKLLKGMKAKEAAQSLAWQAAFSPWEPVQKAAATALKDQEKHSYVPLLLGSMRVPIRARYELYDMPDGSFLMRRALYQEGPEQRQLAVTDLARQNVTIRDQNNRVFERGGPNPALRKDVARMNAEDQWRQQMNMAEARAKALAQAQQQQAAITTQNMTAAALNTRLCSVLSEATGETKPTSPEDWYTWWNDYNEITSEGDKQTTISYQAINQAVVSQANAPNLVSIPVPSGRLECLVAGTPVWTESGPVPIERVRVGDRVIACDCETGQIMLKPVVKTIINRQKATFRVRTANDTLETTGGHLFWIAGQGWLRARVLKPQMRFHTLTGTVNLESIEPGEKQDAFNLVVADFHGYFVGKDKLLTHDNTVQKPTNCIVPGLAGRVAKASR
jgi:hypothetical protein